jgi:hypothetical protein
MRIAQTLVAVAAAAVLGGLGLAAWLGLRHDFSPIAAQMHLNLLGWMSLGLYGLYYCAPGPVLRPRLAWVQAIAAILGFAAMSGGIAALGATGDRRFGALVAVGVLLAAAALALFLVQVLAEGRARGPALRPA